MRAGGGDAKESGREPIGGVKCEVVRRVIWLGHGSGPGVVDVAAPRAARVAVFFDVRLEIRHVGFDLVIVDTNQSTGFLDDPLSHPLQLYGDFLFSFSEAGKREKKVT